MKKIFVACTLGLGLIAFGAGEAMAAPPGTNCFDFTSFCDCMTLKADPDTVGGKKVTRYNGTWENQDCAGTESNLQGGTADLRNYHTGELNTAFGLNGYNWNFSWRDDVSVFDLDLWQGSAKTKVQNDTGYCLDAGACPDNCVTVCGGINQNQDRSSTGR